MSTTPDAAIPQESDSPRTRIDPRWQTPISEPSETRTFLTEIVQVFLFLSALTALLTYPVVFHLTDSVPGPYRGDNFHFLWQLWYPAHAVFNLNKTPLFDPDIFVPYGFDLIRNQDLSPANVLLFMPVTYMLGEVLTYNLLILASYPLTGLGTYLLARKLWGSRLAALLAGIIVAFCEYRYVKSGGHLTMISTHWIPFLFLALERTIERPTIRNGALTGLLYSLCALVTWNYASLTVIAAVLYLAARINWLGEWQVVRRLLVPGIAAGVVTVVLVGPFVWEYAKATTSGAMTARPLQESQAFSASVFDMVIPSVQHPIWGAWVRQTMRAGPNGVWLSEWQIYLGVVALLLAAVGVACLRGRRVAALLSLAIGGFVLALGPSLYFVHPPTLPDAMNQAPISPIPLPVSLLANIPPFSFIRAWARMAFFVQLVVGLLAAGGLVVLFRFVQQRFGLASSRAAVTLTALAILLVTVDTIAVPFGLSSVAPRPVERWLAEQPGDLVFIEFPLPEHGYSGPAMYSTRLTGKRIAMGYASYPPNIAHWPTLSKFPADTTLDILKQWGVTYILVDETRYRAGSEFYGLRHTWQTMQAAIVESGKLEEVTVRGGVHVYAMVDEAQPITITEMLQNPGFEDALNDVPAGWIAVGTPEYRRPGDPTNGDDAEIVVTPRDYLVSAPIAVEPGTCYELGLTARSEEAGSSVRLQVNWLDADGSHLDPETASIEVAATSPATQALRSQVRAPDGGREARVYAVAQEGRVAIDDYTLHARPDGCAPSLTAIPNPVPAGAEPGSTSVNWRTGAGSLGQVWISRDGQPEVLLAEGPTGSRILPIEGGSTYEVRLYEGRSRERLLSTVTVRQEP